MEPSAGERYHRRMLDMLQAVWGEGFLSPGGPDEVARLIGAVDLRGLAVLDIGCGAGGIDVALVRAHGAGFVTAIDVEDTVVDSARALVARQGLGSRIRVVKVAPGPLPFPPGTFDIVFSKDSIVHIADKHALMAEVFRVLRPGGRFMASDWLIGHDHAPSPEMAAYIAAEGLDLGMASPDRYRDAMRKAGFIDVSTDSRNAWYRGVAKLELERLRGPLGAAAARIVGQEFVDQNILIWSRMVRVLASGEHCPTHLRARRPPMIPPSGEFTGS
jgi:SAM-dependent methyltransferase